MPHLTWPNLAIIAAVIALILILAGRFWSLIKKFIKVWVIVVIVLVAFKLLTDAGLL